MNPEIGDSKVMDRMDEEDRRYKAHAAMQDIARAESHKANPEIMADIKKMHGAIGKAIGAGSPMNERKVKGDNRKPATKAPNPGKPVKASVAKAQAPQAGKASKLPAAGGMKKRER
jgi:hypothetical protein